MPDNTGMDKTLCLDDIPVKDTAYHDIRVVVALGQITRNTGLYVLAEIKRLNLPATGESARKIIKEQELELC